MKIFERIGAFLSDDRLLFNLIAIHMLAGLALIGTMLLRRLLVHGSGHLVKMTGAGWLHGIHKEAERRLRGWLFWITLGLVGLIAVGGVIYHLAGRHVGQDFSGWVTHLSGSELFGLGLAAGEMVLLVFVLWFAVRQVRRLRPILHSRAAAWLANKDREESLHRWFGLLERYAVIGLFLTAAWCAGHIIGAGPVANLVVGFSLRVLTILAVSHLLVLACRTFSHALAAFGNRYFALGQFHRYWERVTRLFPFGERCFEAAVYISAASMCIRELHFIAFVADFGPRIVECIGIFFITRVLVELIQVLLNEAFGIYEEDRPIDQKGQTLVPLLQSVCQYLVYFGAGVMMLGVLGVQTGPILAGAGILGLAGGLGAQSLITDFVSGFFILFENQYLVGDYVKLNESAGRVEAVSIRHTQIRDDQGRLHIIPNGQIKSVINYSKGYVVAEVDITLASETSVEEAFRALTEAGRRLRLSRKEVLADTVVKGLVDLTLTDFTVRAVTRVQPGTHQTMQNEYRRLLKEVFDEQKNIQGPRLAA
jgi:small conductance mechanosensitive channel